MKKPKQRTQNKNNSAKTKHTQKQTKNHKSQNSLDVPNPEPVKNGLRGDSIVSPQVLTWQNEKQQYKADKPKHQPVQSALIEMLPTPGHANAESGHLMRTLLAEFLKGFSLRTLIFLLDMVLPQLDAYHAGRRLQHLQPWVSVELAQQHARGQQGTQVTVRYQYEAYAGFHVIQLLAEGAPILLFSDPTAIPHACPMSVHVPKSAARFAAALSMFALRASIRALIATPW